MPEAHDLPLEGKVAAVAADPGHHFSKPVQDRIVLVEGHGVQGDAHAGPLVRHRYLARRRPRLPNLRQVHLIPAELFAFLGEAGFEVAAGDMGENITTTGLDLERMPLGSFIELGPSAIVELTGLRTPCVLIDRFRAGLKRQVLSSAETGPPFKSGVLGVVRAAGPVVAGDSARVRLRFGRCRPCREPCHGPKIDSDASSATHAGHADGCAVRRSRLGVRGQIRWFSYGRGNPAWSGRALQP